MNIILFEKGEPLDFLPASDPRGEHIINILKLVPGDIFEGGIINESFLQFTVEDISDSGIFLKYAVKEQKVKPEYPISVFSSIIRPIDAKKLLKNLSALGAEKIFMAKTDKTEKSYSDGTIWKREKYHPLLIEGAQQGFSPYIPEVSVSYSLDTWLKKHSGNFENKIALDNYEYKAPLNKAILEEGKTVMAVGGERGWSERERHLLREYGFTLYNIGKRILRTETACICGFSILASSFWQ